MWPDFPLFPERASTVAGEVDALYLAAVAVSVFFSLLIALLLFYFFIRYRRRSDNEVGIVEKTSTPLEIIWSVIPLAIALSLFVWGAKVYFNIIRPPEGAVEYFVVGKQWMWKFQHPEGKREINDLHVPVGQPIKLTMTSEDVIHSLFIPAFRVKADVVPGRYSTLWFEATRTGTYHIFCAEYCGAEHSKMGGRIIVMEPDDYEAWLTVQPGERSMAASGEELFAALACNSCHKEGPLAQGPSLVGIYYQPVDLAGGQRTVADHSYLRESILNPAAKMVAGYQPLMPTFQGRVTEEELVELIAYIKSLSEASGDRTSSTSSEG
jgi:cytochrome c oxidase subunit 2